MDDSYLTIANPAECEIKVKGSRFIARTGIVGSVSEARAQLEKIQKKEYAATHNCYAYIVGVPAEKAEFKYSDDGEPGGTAGKPIYDAVRGAGVTNVLLVVTRYFGGTKLGTGGLVKAYSEAAVMAMKESGVRPNFMVDHLRIVTDFSIYDHLKKLFGRLSARELSAEFTEKVTLKIEIRQSLTEQLIAEITEISKGKTDIERLPQETHD